MKTLTQFKKTLILSLLIALALAAGAVLVVGPADATPGMGVSTEFIAGTSMVGISFDEIDVSVKSGRWKARIDTKGASELYVVRNTFQPGGHTGWHTHPGPSLVTVTAGTITAYEGDDPICTPRVYSAGMGFVDPGGGHVHLFRNEGNVAAVTVATQLVPPGATRRIDAPAPGNCPF